MYYTYKDRFILFQQRPDIQRYVPKARGGLDNGSGHEDGELGDRSGSAGGDGKPKSSQVSHLV